MNKKPNTQRNTADYIARKTKPPKKHFVYERILILIFLSLTFIVLTILIINVDDIIKILTYKSNFWITSFVAILVWECIRIILNKLFEISKQLKKLKAIYKKNHNSKK